MKNDDIVTIREDPVFTPEELYRRCVLDKVKSGVCIAVSGEDIHITAHNVTSFLNLLNINPGEETILDLIRNACINSDGVINTEEIGEVVLEKILPSQETVEETLRDAFSMVDVDEDDIITGADIYQLMLGIGKVITDDEIINMLKAVDGDGDGRATFEDFRNFILGIEPEPPKESVTSEDKPADDTDCTIAEDVPLRPVDVTHEPPAEHKKRRKLFSYGHMIAEQLSVVSNMQRLVKVAEKAGDGADEGGDVKKRTKEQGNCTSDEDITADANGHGDDNLTRNCYPSTDSGGNSVNEGESASNDRHLSTESSEPEMTSKMRKQMNGRRRSVTFDMAVGKCSNEFKVTFQKHENVEENMKEMDEGEIKCEEDVNESCNHVTKMCSTTKYSEKSPYYGRVRPLVFSMNPLPTLVVEKSVDSCTDTGSSTDSGSYETSSNDISIDREVIMVDKAQQTTEEFNVDMAEYGTTIKVMVKVEEEGGGHQRQTYPNGTNSSRRDSATLTDIYGIPSRLRKAKGLERAILKRRNTSYDIFRSKSEDGEHSKFPEKSLLKKFGNRFNLPTRSLPCETKSVLDRVRQFSSLSNKLSSYQDKPGVKKENEEDCIPTRPQTARPGISGDRSPSKLGSFDRKVGRIVSQSLDDTFCSKRVNTIELSDITKESVYTPELKKSEHHHGYRSIRPLARVIMAFQSSMKGGKISMSEVSSISRVLEEKGIPYIRPNTNPERKPVSVKPNNNFLLNIELPVEKVFRPQLKRRSTLSHMYGLGDRQNVSIFNG